jgi:hypothetical protein
MNYPVFPQIVLFTCRHIHAQKTLYEPHTFLKHTFPYQCPQGHLFSAAYLSRPGVHCVWICEADILGLPLFIIRRHWPYNAVVAGRMGAWSLPWPAAGAGRNDGFYKTKDYPANPGPAGLQKLKGQLRRYCNFLIVISAAT